MEVQGMGGNEQIFLRKQKTGVVNKHTESLASSLVMRQMQNCAQWDDIVRQFNWKNFKVGRYWVPGRMWISRISEI